MKIAKEFRWEMGHRLPNHFGKCKNVHGHSYKMLVELEGDVAESGMILDYFDLKQIVKPIVEEMDHAFMVNKKDVEIVDLLDKLNSKKVIIDFDSTVENICLFILHKLEKHEFPENISGVKVKIYETYDDFAEASIKLKQ
ncbi:MAG: 6-carboxytetrahydropterin synthase QueD [Bacteroidota bacterium]|nr:6-carboxytetrahydropterin synthase QueD [Bacteroidota bacterium]